MIVLEGKIKCNLFTEDGSEVHTAIINKGQMIVQYEECMNMKFGKQKLSKLEWAIFWTR